MQDLKGKVVIITGARRGMGKSHALLFAKAGAKVAVSDVSQEDCELVVKEIKENNGEAIAVKCDVTNKAQVEELVKKTIKEFGKVDILVNNAGIALPKPFLEMTEEEWDRTLDINLKGCFLCAQAAAKEMAKQKSGSIINISSVEMGGVGVGGSGVAHYCASKGGLVAMTEALAVELAPFNIRVNAIAPGLIETPMIEMVKQDPEMEKALLSRIPLGRAGKSEEVSNLVLFLASSNSSYMTGSTVVVDGGWLAN